MGDRQAKGGSAVRISARTNKGKRSAEHQKVEVITKDGQNDSGEVSEDDSRDSQGSTGTIGVDILTKELQQEEASEQERQGKDPSVRKQSQFKEKPKGGKTEAESFNFIPIARGVVESFKGARSMQQLKLDMMVNTELLKELIGKVGQAATLFNADLSTEEVGDMVSVLTEVADEDMDSFDRMQATKRVSTDVFDHTSYTSYQLPPPSTQPQDTLGGRNITQDQTRAFNSVEPPRRSPRKIFNSTFEEGHGGESLGAGGGGGLGRERVPFTDSDEESDEEQVTRGWDASEALEAAKKLTARRTKRSISGAEEFGGANEIDARIQQKLHEARLLNPKAGNKEENYRNAALFIAQRAAVVGTEAGPHVSGRNLNHGAERAMVAVLEKFNKLGELVKKHNITSEVNKRILVKLRRVQPGALRLYEFRSRVMDYNSYSCVENKKTSAPTPPVSGTKSWGLLEQYEAARNMSVMMGLFYGRAVEANVWEFSHWLYMQCSRNHVVGKNEFEFIFEEQMKRYTSVVVSATEEVLGHRESRGVPIESLTDQARYSMRETVKHLKLGHADEVVFGQAGQDEVLAAMEETRHVQIMRQARLELSRKGGESSEESEESSESSDSDSDSDGKSRKKKKKKVETKKKKKKVSSGTKEPAEKAPSLREEKRVESMVPMRLKGRVTKALNAACIKDLAGGCSRKDCRFTHGLKEELEESLEAQLATLHLGGIGGGISAGKREGERSRLVSLIEAKGGTRSSGPASQVEALPLDIAAAVKSSVVLEEGSLIDAMAVNRDTRMNPKEKLRDVWEVYEGISAVDNERLQMGKAVFQLLKKEQPLIEGLSDEACSMMVGRACVLYAGGERNSKMLLDAGVACLESSTLQGMRAEARVLKGQYKRSGHKQLVVHGSGPKPILKLFPEGAGGESECQVLGMSCKVRDWGHQLKVGEEVVNNQCVILTLAAMVGTKAGKLHEKLRKHFEDKARLFEHEAVLTEAQLQIRLCAHDFKYPQSHDFKLVAHAEEFFKHMRIIVVAIGGSRVSSEASVTVIKSAQWLATRDETTMVLACDGHALVISQEGASKPEAARGVISNKAADAFLRGLKGGPTRIEEVVSVPDGDASKGAKVHVVEGLGECLCGCGEKLVPRASTRAGGLMWEGHSAEVQTSFVKAYVEEHGSTSDRTVIGRLRGKDYQDHCCTTQSDLKSMEWSKSEKEAANCMIEMADVMMGELDRKLIKEGDVTTINKAATAVRRLAEKGDELICEAASSRRAAALLRKAMMEKEGRLSTDPEAIEQLSGLLTEQEKVVLKERSDRGVSFNEYLYYQKGGKLKKGKSVEGTDGDTWHSAISGTRDGSCFVFTGESLKYVTEPVVSKMIAVPKKNELGEENGLFRTVVDMSAYSEHLQRLEACADQFGIHWRCPKMNVAQMKDLCYNVWRMTKQYPGIPIKLAVIDEDGAFKKVLINVADVNATLIVLPTDGVKNAPMVLCASQSAPMGNWSSPAEHDLFSSALKVMLMRVGLKLSKEESRVMAAARAWGGHYVDDLGLLVPELGSAAETYVECAKKLMQDLLGPRAWNETKNAENAVPGCRKKIWGLIVDLEAVASQGVTGMLVTVPEDKVKKLLHQLRAIAKGLGVEDLTLKTVSGLTGLANWMSVAVPGLKGLLPYFYHMMTSESDTVVRLSGPEWLQMRMWKSFALAIHSGIMMMLEYESLGSNVTRSLVGCLSAKELGDLGLDSFWVVLDASGGVAGGWGAVDHHHKRYAVGQVLEYSQLLDLCIAPVDRALGYEGEPIIAVGEMIAFMVSVGLVISGWQGKQSKQLRLIKIVTDNQVVWRSVMKGGSKNPQLQWLLSVLGRWSTKYNFQVLVYWTWTHHNEVADLLSRNSLDEPKVLQIKVDAVLSGFQRVEEIIFRQELMAGDSGTLRARVEGEGNKEVEEEMIRYKMQMKTWASMMSRAATREHTVAVLFGNAVADVILAEDFNFRCVLLLGMKEEEWRLTGGESKTKPKMVMNVADLKADATGADLVMIKCLPLSAEGRLKEVIGAIVDWFKVSKPLVVVVELRDKVETDKINLWCEGFKEAGYDQPTAFQTEDVVNKAMGSYMSAEGRSRVLLHFEARTMNREEQLPMLLPLMSRLGNGTTRALDVVEAPRLREGELRGKFREHFYKQDRGRPQVRGFFSQEVDSEAVRRGYKVKLRGDAEEYEVVMKSRRQVQIVGSQQSRDKAKWVAMAQIQIAWAAAVTVTGLEGPCMPITDRTEQVIVWESRATPPYCRGLTEKEVHGVITGGVNKVLEVLKTREFADETLLALKKGTPVGLLEAVMARAKQRLECMDSAPKGSVKGTRCSGGSKWKNRVSSKQEELLLNTREACSEGASLLMSQGLATGTTRAYDSGCNHWFEFCRLFNLAPLVKSSKDGDQIVFEFIGWLRLKKKLAARTIGVVKSAVRMLHVMNGYPNPFSDNERVRLMMKSCVKEEGAHSNQKIPVTMSMLSNIIGDLDLCTWNDLVLATGLMLGYVFLMRSGELFRGAATPDAAKCLRVKNVRFTKDGEVLLGRRRKEATDLMITFASSKTDQVGNGTSISIKITNHRLCPGRLIQRMFALNPALAKNPEAFLLTVDDGKVLHRTKVMEVLELYGALMGLPPGSFGVISLRAGGASSLWAAGYTAEDIKIRGRWRSECWRIYVWGGQDRNGHLGSDMLNTSASVLTHVIRREQAI